LCNGGGLPVVHGCTATRDAYEDLAAAYELLTAGYPHGRWLAALVALAGEHGLRGRDALDVACGTGTSFLPLLARGFTVVGCDLSPPDEEVTAVSIGSI
jgi:ubiquinone/menaquinone biosynthesis C-methylase UbiE